MHATVQDCIDRRGENAAAVLRDTAGTDVRLERALADASAEIDGYVGTRHPLPLDPVPAILVTACVDIAMYRAAPGSRQSKQGRQFYEDAIRLLRDIAAGRVSLGGGDPDPPAAASSPAIEISAPERVMDRDSLRRIL